MCLQIAQTPTESFYRINQSKITDIVEEAKKDFPIPNIEFIEDPKLEEFAKGLNKKQLEWFVKWLGEDQQ